MRKTNKFCVQKTSKKGALLMYEEKDNVSKAGNINISEEVIAVVAGVAASEINGVAGMCTNFTGGLGDLFGKKNYSKGVKVELDTDKVSVSVSLTFDYGCKIQDVALEVQEKVKREIENMTGLEVVAVDVYVSAIALPKPEKPQSPEENTGKK